MTNIKSGVIRTITALVLMLTLIASGTTMTFAASKAKKMTVYDKFQKKGNMMYCTDAMRIYKVNLKNNEVKVLAKPKYGTITGMKVHKNYVYYSMMGTSLMVDLYRVKKTGGKRSRVYSSDGLSYAIKGSKLYVEYQEDDSSNKTEKRVMKLNGKKVRKSKYKVKNKYKRSNVKGYKLIWAISEDGKSEYGNYTSKWDACDAAEQKYGDSYDDDYYYSYYYDDDEPSWYIIPYLVKPDGNKIRLGQISDLQVTDHEE